MTVPSDSKFVFNPRAADNEYIQEKRKLLKKYEDIVDDLKSRVTMGGNPIFTSLLHFWSSIPNAEVGDLKILGKALVKYAEIHNAMKQLEQEMLAVDLAKQNPDLIAMAFADSSDIPSKFEELLGIPASTDTNQTTTTTTTTSTNEV